MRIRAYRIKSLAQDLVIQANSALRVLGPGTGGAEAQAYTPIRVFGNSWVNVDTHSMSPGRVPVTHQRNTLSLAW